MARFEDALSRKWTMAPVIGDIRRVRDRTDVDLMKIGEGDPPKIAELMDDVYLFVDVLHAIVEPQCKERNIDAESFASGLDGEALHRATEAFWEGMVNFFQHLPRPDLAEMVQAAQSLVNEAVAINLENVKQAMADHSTTGSSSLSLPRSPEASTRAG